MGEQFYLQWHGLLDDTRIAFTADGLEAVLADGDGHDEPLPTDVESAARALDLEPTVTTLDDDVEVSFVTFTKWGGFRQHTFRLARAFPHELIDHESTSLVEYSCGWIY